MILMDINGIQLPMPDHNAHYGSLYPIDRWFFQVEIQRIWYNRHGSNGYQYYMILQQFL